MDTWLTADDPYAFKWRPFPSDRLRKALPQNNKAKDRRRNVLSSFNRKQLIESSMTLFEYLDDLAAILESGASPVLVASDIKERARFLIK